MATYVESGPSTGLFAEARRELTGLTARVEKRALAWLAARTPGRGSRPIT